MIRVELGEAGLIQAHEDYADIVMMVTLGREKLPNLTDEKYIQLLTAMAERALSFLDDRVQLYGAADE